MDADKAELRLSEAVVSAQIALSLEQATPGAYTDDCEQAQVDLLDGIALAQEWGVEVPAGIGSLR